jgi:hypothetical protein
VTTQDRALSPQKSAMALAALFLGMFVQAVPSCWWSAC